ncbi:unnamed protein product [Sphagnum troendelagicum]|uniref:DUF676 domain-containing protein n=1 Tax=Sphagnum troendelagicum TaxID=128251 RepID=A0ABP0UR39_9BRYO
MADENPSWIAPVHDLNQQCTSSKPDLVIIFFHGIGLGKNYEWKETWTSITSDGKRVCWPQAWLPADLTSKNGVRILSLSYDSALLGANEDVTDIGKNLIQSLVCKSEYEPLWEAPIALVGYSFGGLVVKSLVVEVEKRAKQARVENALERAAKENCQKFLGNLKGTIFYSVPHAGGIEDFKEYFIWQCKKFNASKKKQITKSGLLRSMDCFNQQMAHLTVDFDSAVEPSLMIYAFGEGLPVPEVGSVLVPYASAQQLARRNHYKVEDADHLTICKPSSQNAINYSKLKEVLLTIMKGVQTQPTPQMKHIW